MLLQEGRNFVSTFTIRRVFSINMDKLRISLPKGSPNMNIVAYTTIVFSLRANCRDRTRFGYMMTELHKIYFEHFISFDSRFLP